MRKTTDTRTATTFTLADQHPNFASMDAETQAEISAPYVWESEDKARACIRTLVEVNEFEHTEHTAPGLEVHAFYVLGEMLILVVIEDDDAARLHAAVRKQQPVTVTYVKADGDEVVRTIEPRSLKTTQSGDVIVKALDRKSGEHRSFRADRIRAYTVHRSHFVITEEYVSVITEARRVASAPAPVLVVSEWDVYSTVPGTAAALEAPEHVQDQIAEAYALGKLSAFVSV